MHVTAHACNMHELVFYHTCMLCACHMQVIYGTIPYLLWYKHVLFMLHACLLCGM